jgi:hypothetical protein
LQQIQQQQHEFVKNISIALRVARFADDDEFREFVADKKDDIVADDELVCF